MEVRVVAILEEAASDLEEGKAFYEGQEETIGFYFVDSLLADIESLTLFAGIHPSRYGFYRLLSKRFPFAVYYDIEDAIVRVAAVLDMRRDPAWIRKELSNRSESP